MSQQESDICEVCGGVKRVNWTISFEECHPVEVRFDPASLAENWRLCPGHPEPAQKHDGRMDGNDRMSVRFDLEEYVRVSDTESERGFEDGDWLWLDAKQALSLLAWLRQEERELLRMAEEQGE